MQADGSKLIKDVESFNFGALRGDVQKLQSDFANLTAEFRVFSTKVHWRALVGAAIGAALLQFGVHVAGCTPAQRAAVDRGVEHAATAEQEACVFARISNPTGKVAAFCDVSGAYVETAKQAAMAAAIDEAAKAAAESTADAGATDGARE